MLFTVLFFLVLVLSPRVVNTKAFIFGISMCEADARALGRFFLSIYIKFLIKFFFFNLNIYMGRIIENKLCKSYIRKRLEPLSEPTITIGIHLI